MPRDHAGARVVRREMIATEDDKSLGHLWDVSMEIHSYSQFEVQRRL